MEDYSGPGPAPDDKPAAPTGNPLQIKYRLKKGGKPVTNQLAHEEEEKEGDDEPGMTRKVLSYLKKPK